MGHRHHRDCSGHSRGRGDFPLRPETGVDHRRLDVERGAPDHRQQIEFSPVLEGGPGLRPGPGVHLVLLDIHRIEAAGGELVADVADRLPLLRRRCPARADLVAELLQVATDAGAGPGLTDQVAVDLMPCAGHRRNLLLVRRPSFSATPGRGSGHREACGTSPSRRLNGPKPAVKTKRKVSCRKSLRQSHFRLNPPGTNLPGTGLCQHFPDNLSTLSVDSGYFSTFPRQPVECPALRGFGCTSRRLRDPGPHLTPLPPSGRSATWRGSPSAPACRTPSGCRR